jgi:hypothetical protein
MRRFTAGPGDIVVIVPRWIIAAVGLLMLLLGLSASFILLFAGMVTEAMLFTLFVLVLVPLQLLIAYITWRFYWQILILGMMLQALCACTALTGLTGFAGQMYPAFRGTPIAPVVLAIVQARALNVMLAFLLALLIVGIMAGLMWTAFQPSSAAPAEIDYDPYDLDKPMPRPKPRRKGTRLNMWDDN